LVHDPNQHLDTAIAEALPALSELKAAGVVSAIGAGMNNAASLAKLIDGADLDVVLAAGCCTLLDRIAHAALLPLALERDVSVLAAGVFHQGLLVDDPLPASVSGTASVALRERADRMREVCRRHGVSLAAVAVQYSIRLE
jgi:D-threo-aldose 1-dehydrogenase